MNFPARVAFIYKLKISIGQLNWLRLTGRSNNNGAIDVKMDESVLEEKSSFKMLGLPCF